MKRIPNSMSLNINAKHANLYGKFIQNYEMKKLLFTGVILLFLDRSLSAQNDIVKLKEKLLSAADKIESKCIAWRRDIHEHPELGNREFKNG